MKLQESDAFITFKGQIKDAINDLKTKGKRHKQIPNILTLMRLTAPFFIIPAAVIGTGPLVFNLAVFFSLTDLADGFIARKWHLTSELGETLDAVTDKVFSSTLLLAASFTNPILVCNLGLEGVVAGINTYKKLNNQPVKSSMVGKAKTWFLFGLVIAGITYPFSEMTGLINNLALATSVMQIFTIGSYLVKKTNITDLNKDEFIDAKSTEISNNSNIDDKELQKEKVKEIDTSIPKVQSKEREDLRQLKIMREYLVSERTFLEPEENTTTISINNVKSKKDDFKKN